MSLDNQTYTFTLNADYKAALDLATATLPIREAFADTMTTGTGVDQADLAFYDQRTLLAGASESLDLTGGLTDAYGNALVFKRLKLIYVRNLSTTAGDRLLVGGAASSAFTGWTSVSGSKAYVGPSGLLIIYDPSATAMATSGYSTATDDLLKIDNPTANSISYNIVLIGASV